MFKKYWLVELIASNQVKTVRSNCILEGKLFSLPPLDLVYQNCINIGFPSINILSVTRVNKKSAELIKNHINNTEKFNNPNVKEVIDLIKKVNTGKPEGQNPSS